MTTVKEEVDKTKAELEKTIAALSSVRGDLGVQSGLIATNGEELAALKRLGERNYYEFDMRKSRQPGKVGPVRIKLTGTDRKRNRYSLELWADDKKIEKRRKTLLEPVQFYVIGSRVPYELVVNKIDKDQIAGYLATPKDGPRGAAARRNSPYSTTRTDAASFAFRFPRHLDRNAAAEQSGAADGQFRTGRGRSAKTSRAERLRVALEPLGVKIGAPGTHRKVSQQAAVRCIDEYRIDGNAFLPRQRKNIGLRAAAAALDSGGQQDDGPAPGAVLEAAVQRGENRIAIRGALP